VIPIDLHIRRQEKHKIFRSIWRKNVEKSCEFASSKIWQKKLRGKYASLLYSSKKKSTSEACGASSRSLCRRVTHWRWWLGETTPSLFHRLTAMSRTVSVPPVMWLKSCSLHYRESGRHRNLPSRMVPDPHPCHPDPDQDLGFWNICGSGCKSRAGFFQKYVFLQ